MVLRVANQNPEGPDGPSRDEVKCHCPEKALTLAYDRSSLRGLAIGYRTSSGEFFPENWQECQDSIWKGIRLAISAGTTVQIYCKADAEQYGEWSDLYYIKVWMTTEQG